MTVCRPAEVRSTTVILLLPGEYRKFIVTHGSTLANSVRGLFTAGHRRWCEVYRTWLPYGRDNRQVDCREGRVVESAAPPRGVETRLSGRLGSTRQSG